MLLNFHNAFVLPFLAQPFGFFTFALRAISLLAIKPIISVSLWAMSLLGIDICCGCRVSLGIFGCRKRVQVLRIHAVSPPASMIDYKSSRYLSSGKPQRNAMSTATGTAECQIAIPISVFVSIPDNAISRARAFVIESLSFFSGWASHIRPFQLASEA